MNQKQRGNMDSVLAPTKQRTNRYKRITPIYHSSPRSADKPLQHPILKQRTNCYKRTAFVYTSYPRSADKPLLQWCDFKQATTSQAHLNNHVWQFSIVFFFLGRQRQTPLPRFEHATGSCAQLFSYPQRFSTQLPGRPPWLLPCASPYSWICCSCKCLGCTAEKKPMDS